MQGLLERILGFLFPDRCLGCRATGDLLCSACIATLRPYPQIVRRMPETLAQVRVGFVFDGPLRIAVHHLKYRKLRRVARPLAAMLAPHLREQLPEADAIMAVPLHPRRLAQRGYNQAEELARELAQIWGVPLVHGLSRVRTTERQALLNTQARSTNVLGAFEWVSATRPPRRVILIDDVLTTGATMGACAESLLLAGSDQVYAVALARSRPDLDRAG
jgi:ComF family protein